MALLTPKSGIGINLSSKFQLKLTILVFYTKFAQQGYFQSKGDRITLGTEFHFKQTILFYFFSISVFYHDHSRITGLQGKGEGISLTPRYHFHPFHRHLDISQVITAESSPLHIASSRTRTGNLWFPGASR